MSVTKTLLATLACLAAAGAVPAQIPVTGGAEFGLLPAGAAGDAGRAISTAPPVPSFQTPSTATISVTGDGRFGLVSAGYETSWLPSGTSVSTRLRFDFNVSAETDSGVTFGGLVRLQSETGGGYPRASDGAHLSPAQLYARWN